MTMTKSLLPYAEIRDRMRHHPLRQSEVPVEHAVSLPLPTRRCATPGYAFFASAATRSTGEPVLQAAPDRWWALSARSGHLLIYALWDVHPFADGRWESQQLPPVSSTIQELQQSLKEIGELIDSVVPDFFDGGAGDGARRQTLLRKLSAILPAPLLPQYRALTTDFFEWLAADGETR